MITRHLIRGVLEMVSTIFVAGRRLQSGAHSLCRDPLRGPARTIPPRHPRLQYPRDRRSPPRLRAPYLLPLGGSFKPSKSGVLLGGGWDVIFPFYPRLPGVGSKPCTANFLHPTVHPRSRLACFVPTSKYVVFFFPDFTCRLSFDAFVPIRRGLQPPARVIRQASLRRKLFTGANAVTRPVASRPQLC